MDCQRKRRGYSQGRRGSSHSNENRGRIALSPSQPGLNPRSSEDNRTQDVSALSNDSRDCAAYRCRGLSLRRPPAHRSLPLADRQSSCRVSHRPRFLPQLSVYPGVYPRRFHCGTACHSRSTLLNCCRNFANHTIANHTIANHTNVNRSSANCGIVNRSCGGDFAPARNSELPLPPKS
jgi:hypothetical protein